MAKKKKESLSRTLAEVSKGVTKTVANDKSVSAKVRKQAKSDYRKASRISNSSASKNYIRNSRLRRAGSIGSTSATSASMANRMRGESASQRNAGGNTIREIAKKNTPKKNSVSRTYSELQNKTKDMNLTDTAVGRGMARAGLTAKGTAKEAYGGIKTTFSAIRDPNEERMIKADKIREQRGEQVKGNKYEGAYDKLRNAQRDNREQRAKDLKSASKMLESASADKEKAKKGLGKVGKFALDVESALLGMAGDAAVGAVTGTGQVGALGSMFVRSFGGGYDLAKREGASDSQAALYGATVGGMEALSEKMFNVGKAFKGVFGAGLGDDIINSAASKGAEKLAKKFESQGMKNVVLHGSNYLASALTEGLEEVAVDVADPFVANAIYARAVGNPHSFDAGQTGYDFLVGAALGGLGGGIAEASNYSQGGQVKNVLGKDGLKEVADRVAYADEDSGISDSAKAISQMILNGEDVANAQALKLYKAAEAQEQKNFTQYRDSIKGATSIIERDNLISPSGLTVDESGQFIPSIGDNTNIKFQEARTEARNEAEKLQLKDDMAASIGDTIASIKTGIGVVDDIETIVRYPEAKAVYESVTGETLPSGRKALREYLYKKNAENRVQSAREETEFWKDQAVGLLSQTETEDFGGNGQAVFTKATENLDVNELGNSALTKVRTTINDYYNSAKLGIPFSTLNDIAKPEYDAVSEDIKREAYNAGILDSNDIYKYLDGVAVNKDESIKSSANKENRNANPGKLYVDADNAARKYFTNSQQKMWKALAEEFGIGIHIMDAESFSNAMESKGQETPENAEDLPNGFYDKGEIYLNVETPDRATRYVFMHEFSHFLEQIAPKEFSELRKRMIDALIEDGSLERRLSRKRMQYGEDISQDDLIDEILADSTYEFLNDKDFANGIAKESENLAQAIINAIRNLIRKIRNVLARDEYTPSQNANMYAQLGILKDMETLWLDAVNAARNLTKIKIISDTSDADGKPSLRTADDNNSIANNPETVNAGKFSMKEPVEETDKMIAWHNMSIEGLKAAAELGGLAMPSFAIKPAENPHLSYGPVSVIARKESVEPSKDTRIFNGDAWTPDVGDLSIDYKINDKELTRVRRTVEELVGNIDLGYLALDYNNASDKFNRWRGDVYQAYGDETALKYAYLKNKGIDIELPTKEKTLSNAIDNEGIKYAAEHLFPAITNGVDEIERAYIGGSAYFDEHPEEVDAVRMVINNYYAEKFGSKFAEKEIYPKESFGFSTWDGVIRALQKYRTDGIETEIDKYAIDDAINKKIDDAAYKRWLNNLFDGVIEKAGIRNEKELFTPSGNRRSFDALHWDYNLANIVNALKKKNQQGKTNFLSGPSSAKGAALKDFKNIEEVRNELNRIVEIGDESIKDAYDEFSNAVHDISLRVNPNDKYGLDGASDIAEILANNKTKKKIQNYLAKEFDPYYHYDDIEGLAQDIYNLIDLANNLPMEYFEAKLYRAYSFDEAAAVIVPDNTPQGLVSKLRNQGANVLEYKEGDDADRVEKLNSIEGVKFSRKDSEGNELSDGQIDFFADSKARDEDGDLLVGYHGTSQGGFNTFDISREKPGFFTTSKRDADSYGGNDVIGKMYNPSETESDRAYITKTATIKDILDNPNSFNINDIKAAYDSYDLDNPFIEMRREYEWEYDDFIDSMREFVNSATEEEKQMYLNTEFSTSSDVGEKTTRYNNRMTYSAYFNINNPMIVDLKQRNADDGRFYELLERAKANKNYDGFICRNVKLGRYHDNGTVICPFYPEQVKDTGNLNPTKDADIRFSKKENVESVPTDEEVYEYMASHPEIYKEMWSFDEADQNYIKHKQNTYAELETKVEQLKQNQKKTHGKVLDEKSVRPAMNELVKSILQASEQGRGVKKTDNKMVNDCVANAKKIFTAYKNSDTELMITTSLNAAESMVESLKFIDDSMYVYYKDLRDYLKNTPIRVSDTIKSDIADYSAWRKSKFGKIRISDVGIPVDDVYTELCEKFPEMFDRELSNPTDQLLRMGEAIEEIQPYVVYLSSEEYDNLIRQTAGDLIDITVKGRAYKSMADRYEERISAVKQRAEEARKDAQKKKKESISKERERADARVAEEKDKREQAVSKERKKADARVAKEIEKRKKADNRRKEAYKRRKSMKKLVDDYKWLSSRILDPKDDKHVPDRMVAPLAEILQYIDLETEYSKKFEKKTGKPTMVAVNLRNLKSALEDVSKSSEANWILEDEDLPQMIEELQKRIGSAAIYELDNSELDAVQALLHAIRVDVSNANKAFVASRSIDDTAKAVIWEANEYTANSKKRRSGGIVNQLLNESMVKPMEFFEHLGPTMKSVYMGLRRGMDVQSNRMKETRAFFAEVFEGYGKKGKPGSEVQKWRSEKTLKEFELESGEKISLNTAQIMSLYCLSKREQALGHIYGQGICASEIRDFGIVRSTIGEKEVHKRSTTMVTREDIINIISNLTDEQVKMANKLQDYLNTTVAQWGNETSLLMYDRKKFTEENYFPIKTQDVYLDANFEKRQRNIESIKNFGFTKGTVVNANNPIVIDDIFAVVAKHVNQMILYNAYAPAISDFTRVYNYREVEDNQVESVQAILADTYGGKIIDQYISKFMSDLQSNTQTRRGGYERVANILLANYKKAAIGASPRVALQQPTAMVRALAEIDAKYFVKMEHSPQLLQMATKKDNALKEMLEHCPIAYWKSMGFNQVDMARDIEDIMMNMEWSRLDVLTMSIYGALDTYTWSKIWKAIKAEQKDLHPEVEYESDEFWELCNERAIEVFDKTQVVDSVFHRSDVMRSDNLLIKSITSFMSEPTTTFNMLRSNLMRANDLRVQGKGKEAFKLTRRTLNVYIANAFACAMAAAIADAILKKQAGDDDDEENKSFIEFWLANTIVNFKSNVSPLNLMPITRDFSSFADGWGTKNMFEEGIALVIEDAVAIKDKATDPASTKKTWEELITELAKDSSYLTGIPVKNFMRYGAGILDFLGINAFAAEKDSEGGQSKSLFGEILEMAGFSNGDDSANSQSQSLESQYEESWLTKKLHEAGITEGTRLDNVLNFFGLNKSIEEQKEEHYQDMLSAAKAAGKGYVGVERDEKIYSKATDGYTKLAEAGEFDELARIRRVLVELDVDTTNFDERVESHIKTGIKKQIGEKGDSKLRNRLLNQLKEVYGYTDEQISTDVLAKTDTATAFQKALCEDNYDEAVKQLRYLRQAGLTYEAFLDLYEKRWKVIDAKTTGTFSWPAQGRISSGFGQRWGTLHAGIDIAMPTGTEVVASDGGEVVYTGYNSAMGNYVDIKHSNGYVTRYQHLSSYGVLKGEKVKKGQYIASSGNTGNSTGPHLHFAVYRSTSHSGCSHSTAVDPSIFLKSS